jgi:hypothetical protein
VVAGTRARRSAQIPGEGTIHRSQVTFRSSWRHRRPPVTIGARVTFLQPLVFTIWDSLCKVGLPHGLPAGK